MPGLECFPRHHRRPDQLLTVITLVACCLPFPAAGQSVVSFEERQLDLQVLDSLVLDVMSDGPLDMSMLSARDALSSMAALAGDVDAVEWGVAVHGWLRSKGDAHLRVNFRGFSDDRTSVPPPDVPFLLDPEGPWARFGPGPGVPESAREAWLKRTWPWICSLGGGPDSGLAFPTALEGPGYKEAEIMTVREEEGFVHWLIRGFGLGEERAFRREFRAAFRQVKRSGLPVLLDLRGNVGGFRSRRHAVLSAFVKASEWPKEQEGGWSGTNGALTAVPPMPAAKCLRPIEEPVAVIVDGLSFSASLLLVDALLHAERARLFGRAPLGRPGGCSGNPEQHRLPGSGLIVEVPTRKTILLLDRVTPYGLPDGVDPTGAVEHEQWQKAVDWLLSSTGASPQ